MRILINFFLFWLILLVGAYVYRKIADDADWSFGQIFSLSLFCALGVTAVLTLFVVMF